jgi:hypothetical protein
MSRKTLFDDRRLRDGVFKRKNRSSFQRFIWVISFQIIQKYEHLLTRSLRIFFYYPMPKKLSTHVNPQL